MDILPSTLVKKEQHSFLYNIVRRVLLASVGAAALAEEEIQDFLQKLVERGDLAAQERDSLAAEILDSSRKNLKRVTGLFNSQVEIRSQSEASPADTKGAVQVNNYNTLKLRSSSLGRMSRGTRNQRKKKILEISTPRRINLNLWKLLLPHP